MGGGRGVVKLIIDAIKSNDPELTYKYTVLATNTACITTHTRDFKNYMNAYIARLKNYGTWNGSWEKNVRQWTSDLKYLNLNQSQEWKNLKKAYEDADAANYAKYC